MKEFLTIINCGLTNMSGGRMSLVSLLAAIGTITLLCIPDRAPSRARVLDNPTKPSLAEL